VGGRDREPWTLPVAMFIAKTWLLVQTAANAWGTTGAIGSPRPPLLK
jgi:hypothetical protein